MTDQLDIALEMERRSIVADFTAARNAVAAWEPAPCPAHSGTQRHTTHRIPYADEILPPKRWFR